MTPEQFSQFLTSNEKATSDAVQKFVNGKIDHLTARTIELQSFMENHSKEDKEFQERIEPFLQGIAGLKVIRNIGIWFAGGIVAYLTIKGFFK